MDRFQAWIDGLDERDRKYYGEAVAAWSLAQRSRALELASILDKMGCSESEAWAFSEIQENIAQVLRFAFLMGVRKEIEHCAKFGLDELGSEHPSLVPLVVKLKQIATGSELRHLFAVFGKSLADNITYLLDQGCSGQLVEVGSTWALVEFNDDCQSTGRDVGGLHESSSEDDFTPQI